MLVLFKAEGFHVSPYGVRKAIENTCVPICSSPEERLTTGMGLMQVDKLMSSSCACVYLMLCNS